MRLVSKPSPAMIVALIALFVALGGSGYAATQLKSSKIKYVKKSVPGKALRLNSVTGKQIKESKLKQVPSAKIADIAGAANTANFANVAGTANRAFHSSALFFDNPGGTGLFTVLSRSLPAGSYVVLGRAELSNDGAGKYFTSCNVLLDGRVESAQAIVAEEDEPGETVSFAPVVARRITSPKTASLRCEVSTIGGGGTQPTDVDVRHATLTAMQVNSLTGETPD